ncbi:TPA: serine hydrolase family protein [Burkholderia stabilis]|nr:serine hydrolase family protein [Burkholderia stabilis]HDR9651742.1 serine hydrolase family protein [Burkholderia stabilis]HDR9659813.1 serine hydrolase family protein [Burkholderia stabilis]HDR9682321.1 serine hydrolase family protein [Burkholderia stabilis]
MTLATTPTILIVPGLRDHVEDHWQTHLERRLPNARSVAPLEADKLSRAARVAALDAALAAIDGPVILVAHSAGVMIAVHWARQATRAIHGALLAAPADLDAPMPDGYPTPDAIDAHGWTPVPTERLPFPSIVAASRNDPLARFERAEALAAGWGSKLVDLGEVGHLNPASGYGEWHDAERLIGEVAALGESHSGLTE